MRHLLGLSVLPLLAALFAFGCGDNGNDDAEGRLNVVATTAVIASLAEQIGGDHIEVVVLAGSGVDPHDVELTPGQRAEIEDADLVLRHGIGLDEYLDDVTGEGERVITVTDGVTIRDGEEQEDEADDQEDEAEGHEADGHSHEGEDPHVWHDPANVQVMAENIARALSERDEANSESYSASVESLTRELDELDAEIEALINSIPPENRKVVTNHDAFGYFFDRYGLEFIGAVFPASGEEAEPSAGQIATLTDLIRDEGVKAIFSESTVDPKIAGQLAQDTGVAIVDDLYGDSLGEPGSGAETVPGMLRHNARRIAEALK